MHKSFWIICLVVVGGLLVLSLLGLSSLGMHEKGLHAERQQEFIAAARQISFNVKKKVDSFLQTEQARPYTEYQLYYAPDAMNHAQPVVTVVKSPLTNLFSNGLAYGYFQLESNGNITSPHFGEPQVEGSKEIDEHTKYFENLKNNLLPSLGNGATLQVRRIEPAEPKEPYAYGQGLGFNGLPSLDSPVRMTLPEAGKPMPEGMVLKEAADKEPAAVGKGIAAKTRADNTRRTTYPIALDDARQNVQVVRQSRSNYELNTANAVLQQQQVPAPAGSVEQQTAESSLQMTQDVSQQVFVPQAPPQSVADIQTKQQAENRQRPENDTVQVRIEPFVPITVPEANGHESVFAGQVYMLRHIQIEDKHLIQGFRLDENELLRQISESALQFVGRGMGFDISKTERADAAFTAILDFGFGEVVLNLMEQQPDWIQTRAVRIRNWFFAILGVVWLAVIAAMAALWRNMHEQVQLSRKKDDFISAVSHELRTPLTSIRMYTEMLEKDWVKTDAKRREYYTTMRQESERLTRLIENVLDFSRIQRGKKQYDFVLGDIHEPIAQAAEIMRPCIEKAGFALVQEFDEIEPFMFDRDAVMQIIINLLDNAVKYAKTAEDKRIFLRTRRVKNKVLIEVEDRGPGIPRSYQKKVFDAFYRCEDESTRQTTGTGLGLALVKRLAQAHNGSVEIAAAKPAGVLFRITLEPAT
jgi:signal transduction histidine kinase